MGTIKRIIFRINTGNNILNITVYNQVYLMDNLKSGKTVTVIGKYDKIKKAKKKSRKRRRKKRLSCTQYCYGYISKTMI